MLILLLILTPLVSAILSTLVRKKVHLLEYIAVAATVAEFILTIGILLNVIDDRFYSFGSYFSVDGLSALTLPVVAFAGLIASFYSIGYIRAEVAKEIIGFRRVRQYFVLLHLFLMAMFFAVSTFQPILMWIAIEAITLSTSFLVSFYNKPSATEAAWKYLVINSIGLLLGFFGTLLFMTATTGTASSFVGWDSLVANGALLNPFVAKAAFIFILIGYGTKIGFVPLHTWKPDTYSKAPTPIVALFSGSLLNVAFLPILRFKSVVDVAVGPLFSEHLLIFFGLLSLIVAAFIIFSQKNYKRLFAYSSIEHAGVVALGFGFGGLGAFAAILHLMYHSFAKLALFLAAGNIFLKYGTAKIEKVRGVLSVLPVTGVVLFIGFLAAAGLPPFGIFFTEFYILLAGIGRYPLLSAVAALFLVLAFVGMLKHIVSMVFGKPEEALPKGEFHSFTVVPLIAVIIVLTLSGFFLPEPLKLLIESVVLTGSV